MPGVPEARILIVLPRNRREAKICDKNSNRFSTNESFWAVVFALLLAGIRLTAQTVTNGGLVWNNDTNVSLYVVLESPNLTLPRKLWNVIGLVTNTPPAVNPQIFFPISLTNRYPVVACADYFSLMEWTGGLPAPQAWTNWAVVEEVCTPTVDGAGRMIGYSTWGQWFYPTNDITSSLEPYPQEPGVTNNNPDFNIIHF